MVFSSILFLFRFLPATFLIYYLTPRKFKNTVLLIASLIFYSWGEAKYFPLMLATILINYFSSLAIEHNRGKKRRCQFWLLVSLIFSFGALGFFKYSGFIIENINALLNLGLKSHSYVLPLGISFYTFQTLSYTIDVYRGKIKAERNIIDFGTFVVLFPQLIAGPIVLYTDINRELKERSVNLEQIQSGIQVFLLGLASKVLIANNIGSLWTELEALGFARLSTPLAWLGILAYSFQIYFDFNGYSLMAIGLGRMLSFDFPKNFDYPYISTSITEFWRRWHMTLGSWFREYLYIPMGGNRVSRPRHYFNLFVVWFATGLWHGASWNFILWGLFFCALLILEKMGLGKWLKEHQGLAHVYVIFLLLISWSIFAITDMGQLGVFLGRLFSFQGGYDWVYYLRNYGVTLLLAAVFSTPALTGIYHRLAKSKIFCMVFFGAILIFSTAYLVDASYNPFLYFRF